MYGESRRRRSAVGSAAGLSPRVRGIRQTSLRPTCGLGSIPACTGNPIWNSPCSSVVRVYPRVYGESQLTPADRIPAEGLSPRVRGIPGHKDQQHRRARSIPACTGNPRCGRTWTTTSRVYPRVYGESAGYSQAGCDGYGLSPRVRGILPRHRDLRDRGGSIPACTGNPLQAISSLLKEKVYPRVYGESLPGSALSFILQGLSPRVRGIPHLVGTLGTIGGSIPACTGNPSPIRGGDFSDKVYPRVYGESGSGNAGAPTWTGLSPRVRGIRRAAALPRRRTRSIPACTGNPGRCLVERLPLRVYPRVYGESTYIQAAEDALSGLSPRVRGIQEIDRPPARQDGSIPACTGNPRRRHLPGTERRVYPRVYGESGDQFA